MKGVLYGVATGKMSTRAPGWIPVLGVVSIATGESRSGEAIIAGIIRVAEAPTRKPVLGVVSIVTGRVGGDVFRVVQVLSVVAREGVSTTRPREVGVARLPAIKSVVTPRDGGRSLGTAGGRGELSIISWAWPSGSVECKLSLSPSLSSVLVVCRPLSSSSCILALTCLLYTSPSPRDDNRSRMPSSA